MIKECTGTFPVQIRLFRILLVEKRGYIIYCWIRKLFQIWPQQPHVIVDFLWSLALSAVEFIQANKYIYRDA
jgi:hypothetical protein